MSIADCFILETLITSIYIALMLHSEHGQQQTLAIVFHILWIISKQAVLEALSKSVSFSYKGSETET